MDKYDLEERLMNFAVMVIAIVESMPDTKSGNYLAGQILRSGNSPALNYGEAQSGESRKDFIHKMKIALKELRETYNGLRIIQRAKLYRAEDKLNTAIKENNELISIFVKSVKTAQDNDKK